jgi:hypothetical protein
VRSSREAARCRQLCLAITTADGVVDAGDYVLSRKTMDANRTLYGGDGSGNGIVGSEDYSIWRPILGDVRRRGTSIEGVAGAGSSSCLGKCRGDARMLARIVQISSYAGWRGHCGTRGRRERGTKVAGHGFARFESAAQRKYGFVEPMGLRLGSDDNRFCDLMRRLASLEGRGGSDSERRPHGVSTRRCERFLCARCAIGE